MSNKNKKKMLFWVQPHLRYKNFAFVCFKIDHPNKILFNKISF